VLRDPEEMMLGGVQARAAEVDVAKRGVLVGDLVASVSAQAVARGHHTSAVFHALIRAVPIRREDCMQLNSAQPTNKNGLKYFDCPFYKECLSHAAKRNWKSWSCEQCANLSLMVICQKLKFIEPYYELLAPIYPEFKRKYEPVMNVLHPEP
jgi:hypothetical protein